MMDKLKAKEAKLVQVIARYYEDIESAQQKLEVVRELIAEEEDEAMAETAQPVEAEANTIRIHCEPNED